MLEKPDIPDELILSRLQDEYDLHNALLTFLPIGADLNTVVYRVVAEDRTAYFLKLRKGFEEITVRVPLFLNSQGIKEVIVPYKTKNLSEKSALGGVLAAEACTEYSRSDGGGSNFRIETKSNQYWANFGDYKMILYPFVEGQDGFERELSDHHRRRLGMALKGIHSAEFPQDLKRHIPKETFSPRWRDSLKSLQALVENKSFEDPTTVKLAKFMQSERTEITRLVARAEALASQLQSNSPDFVLCHTDVHGGNILVSDQDELYIVDWDNPLLAPKERDLMFIGGGIDEIWNCEREGGMFYEGYGNTEIDLSALTYYRYERIIEDLVVIGKQLLLSNQGGADRERSFGWFRSNFEPGNTIDIADKTYRLLVR